MIGYVTLGTNDMARGVAFYDALVAELGGKRMMEEEGMFVAWNVEPEKPGLALTKPFDGQSATVGNGVMVALMVESKEQVDALHQKAMELGGS
ncbi:MAG: VOC family protein, partial [Pseudomonadota bacterium]